jgi:hypothetical protein
MPAPRLAAGVVVTTWANALAQYVDDNRSGIVAIGIRTSNSSTTTTEVGVLRVDDIPITGGHRYEIKTNSITLHSTVAADVIRATLRYTTDGSTPSTSSDQLCDAQIDGISNTTWPPTSIAAGTYVPASDETLSVILTVARKTGSGNASLLGDATFPLEILITDLGVDTGDVGTDI